MENSYARSQPATIIEDPALLRKGHFAATSGKHTDIYWLKYRLLENPALLARVCEPIMQQFSKSEFDIVVGPTLGGVLVAYEVARQSGKRAVFAERSADGHGRFFRQPTYLKSTHRVLIADDILMTGWSLQQVVDAVLAVGAEICGIAVILDRSMTLITLPEPVYAVHRLPMADYDPVECPLCQRGVPLTMVAGKA